jgi:hypothetical protein
MNFPVSSKEFQMAVYEGVEAQFIDSLVASSGKIAKDTIVDFSIQDWQKP